jgi:hypothetical protein
MTVGAVNPGYVVVVGSGHEDVTVSLHTHGTAIACARAALLAWSVLSRRDGDDAVRLACGRHCLIRNASATAPLWVASGASDELLTHTLRSGDVVRLAPVAALTHRVVEMVRHRLLDPSTVFGQRDGAANGVGQERTEGDPTNDGASAGLLDDPVLPAPANADDVSDASGFAGTALTIDEIAAANNALRPIIAGGLCRELLCAVCRKLPFDAVRSQCCGATMCRLCAQMMSPLDARTTFCAVCEQETVAELPLVPHESRNALVARFVNAYKRTDVGSAGAGLLAFAPPGADDDNLPNRPPPDYATALFSNVPPSGAVSSPGSPLHGQPVWKQHRTENNSYATRPR